MESTTLTNTIGLFLTSILLLFSNISFACLDYEQSETIRLSLFKAELPGMEGFRPFYYCANAFNGGYGDSQSNGDTKKNCKEWQDYLGKSVSIKDIEFILYQTTPDVFEKAFQQGTLLTVFEGNTFIKILCSKRYNPELKYLRFLKELEYATFFQPGYGSKWESWENNTYTATPIEAYGIWNPIEFIDEQPNDFLKYRYAFQLIRMNYYLGNQEFPISLYDKYFEKQNTNSIIKVWSLFFKALTLDLKGEIVKANYLYSLVFDKSDEKKMAIMQRFNTKDAVLKQTLALAKNENEKGIILSVRLLNYPGRALANMQEMKSFLLKSQYFAPLIKREINKLEDWIYTPMFTQYAPSVDLRLHDNDYFHVNNNRMQNIGSDMKYLYEFKSFLGNCLPLVDNELRDYLCLAIAHLSFMNNEYYEADVYLGKMSNKSQCSLTIQKNIISSLISLQQGNIMDQKNQQQLLKNLISIEKEAKSNTEVNKCLYSLLRLLSASYEKKHHLSLAGLMFMKSDVYKTKFEDYNYTEEEDEYRHYWYMAWYDRRAGIADIDTLIVLLQNKNKTPFEKYLCDQKLATVYDYLDLRSCIAFRNNHLQETEKSLRQIPPYYYKKHDLALNENPFDPKCLSYVKVRDFKYPFSKLKFIRTLIKLENSVKANNRDKAEKLLQLGHAYYNCSYFGNSWMMVSNEWSTYENHRVFEDDLFGPNYHLKTAYQNQNYYGLTLARDYYKQALACAVTDEQKAMANLMLHVCDYESSSYHANWYDWDHIDNDYLRKLFLPSSYLKDFYYKFNQTETFRTYRCPLLDEFIGVHFAKVDWLTPELSYYISNSRFWH